MEKMIPDATDLSKEELLSLIGHYFDELVVHYGLWFTEAVHSKGIEKALEMEHKAINRYFPLLMKRLAPHLNLELDGSIPKVITSKSREELLLLISDLAKTWLAGDGIWFQAVEMEYAMADAKAINDTCWSHFARMEAYKIRQYLGIGSNGGLDALEQALRLRIYAGINANSVEREGDDLIFSMTECRVQAARRRKGMEDYPCKSGGIVEYTEFAKGVDPRIETECVWCPPDRIPDEQFCRWRFRLK
jgi:hypothetical protein